MQRVAIDIGGTFTDTLVHDEQTGELQVFKVPTTPAEPERAIVDTILGRKLDVRNWATLTHGTTLASNAIIERKGAKVGVIASQGHTHTLIHQRQAFLKLPVYSSRKPDSLVTRDMVEAVRGRINASGTELEPLHDEDVRKAAIELKRKGVDIILISFISSYANNSHELRAKQIVKEMFPDIKVVAASEIAPEILEYERASTAFLSAYVTPLTIEYYTSLSSFLRQQGCRDEFSFLFMQASGGTMAASLASEKAIYTLESGPAGGVIASQFIGKMIGAADVISFDMGGTTTKVSCIVKGEPILLTEYRFEGYPVRIPCIDMVEIGAGGGTIAWIDEIGNLHVGPRGAGAYPGPACYNLGSKEATVTDAHVVLGHLDPELFTEAEVKLKGDLAFEAVKKLADFYNMDVVKMASGILEIANNNMKNAISLVSVERGHDPRDFCMVASGGAGPMHAAYLAREVGIPKVVIPPFPGLHSALGMLVADLRHDFITSILRPAKEVSAKAINEIFEKSEREAKATLEREGIKPTQSILERYLDMRYLGEQYTALVVPIPAKITEEQLPDIENACHRKHQEFYRHAAPNAAVEIVNARLVARGKVPPLTIKAFSPKREPTVYKTRVYFDELKCFVNCAAYKKSELPPDFDIKGPAIVYYYDATAIIYPGQSAKTDIYGNMIIKTW